MKFKHHLKSIILIFLLITCFNYDGAAQDFYKDFSRNMSQISKNRRSSIKRYIKRIQLTIDSFEKENNRKFFTSDTIYLINFLGAESGLHSTIIWTKNASCSFADTGYFKNRELADQKMIIKTNDSKTVHLFNKNFKRIIETIDTAAYLSYADNNWVYDGSWITPMAAVKRSGEWYFIPFKGNGHAVNCFQY